MVQGYNKADILEHMLWKLSPEYHNRPCVFLSHKRKDKSWCRVVAEYFKEAGLDYYLDELDDDLQAAAALEDASKITECIKKGIRLSTHMMVVVSAETYTSHWVPYEIGYGQAALIDASAQNSSKDYRLSVLTLKDAADLPLPSFMNSAHIIKGTITLNQYIYLILNERQADVQKILQMRASSIDRKVDSVLSWYQ